MEIADYRREYTRGGLTRESLKNDPFDQFRQWWDQAVEAELTEPNAFSLATVDARGRPSNRTVLLKGFDRRGMVFYTNYTSAKAKDMEANPWVAALFPWLPLERQVKVTGTAERVAASESLAYFLKRPLGSRLGAWVSPQSAVISRRAVLEKKLDEMKRKFADGKVPLPDNWGGYRIVPEAWEFWQGRRNRLHDRFEFRRNHEFEQVGEDTWSVNRLAP